MFSNKFTDQIRVRTPGDDSSSVSSMSSFSRRSMCHVCKEPETLPTKPLVRCMTCKGSWHPGCHRPSIDDPKRGNFRCAKCLRKMPTISTDSVSSIPSSEYMRVSNGGPESSKQQNGWKRSICQKQDCDAPVYNSTRLCKRHEVEERHKNATAQKRGGVIRSPLPKSIQKKKLYPVKLDEDMKSLKRKRPSYGKSGGNDAEIIVASASDVPKDLSLRPTGQTLSGNLSAPRNWTFDRFPPFVTVENAEDTGTPTSELGTLNLTFSTEKYADESVNPRTIQNRSDDNAILPESAGLQTNTHKKTSLIKVFDKNEIPAHTPLDAPRIPLQQKVRKEGLEQLGEDEATMPSQDDIEMSDYRSDGSTIPIASILNPEAGHVKRPGHPSRQPNELSFDAQQPINKAREERKAEKEEKGNEEENAEEAGKADHLTIDTTRVPIVLDLTLMSSSTSSSEDIIRESFSPKEAVLPPSSLEAQRQQKAESFDPSGLDSWLKRQAQSEDMQCNHQELIETQIWGHIDPQAVWPIELSAEWLDEKRAEIEARGGRKANFGKLLTKQVIKERKEKGWKVHQNKNFVDNEKSEDAARALQELFGIKNIDDLEPTVRSGQLVMVEKAQDGEKQRQQSAVHIVG